LRSVVPTHAGVCLLMADIEPLKPSNTGWLIADVVPDTFAFGWARTEVDPALLKTEYGPEIWSLYQAGLLSNETPLTGRFERSTADVDMQAVLREIDDARDEEAARRLRMATAV